MFIEAREVYNQAQRQHDQKIDAAIEAVIGTPEKEYKAPVFNLKDEVKAWAATIPTGIILLLILL